MRKKVKATRTKKKRVFNIKCKNKFSVFLLSLWIFGRIGKRYLFASGLKNFYWRVWKHVFVFFSFLLEMFSEFNSSLRFGDHYHLFQVKLIKRPSRHNLKILFFELLPSMRLLSTPTDSLGCNGEINLCRWKKFFSEGIIDELLK